MKLRTIYINDTADLQTLVAEAASLMAAMQLDTPEIVENIFKHALGAAKNLGRSAIRAPIDVAKQKYSNLSSRLQGLSTSATPWGDVRQQRAAKRTAKQQRRAAKQAAAPAAAPQPAQAQSAATTRPAAGGAGKLSPTKIADNLLAKLGQLDPVTQKQLAKMLLHHLQPYSR